jgi:DNA-directed RNA polymerase subunit RPC12/RpoP
MKNLEEYNKERLTLYEEQGKVKTGIACPQCGDELLETAPGIILCSLPPQKNVHCPTCQYTSYIIS